MRLRILSLLILLLVGCTSFEPRVSVESTPAPTRAVSPAKAQSAAPTSSVNSQIVVRGDTLYAIAFKHRLDVRDLAAWNNINAPHVIYPGQLLRLTPPSRSSRVSVSAAPPARPVAPRSPPVGTTPLQTIVRSQPPTTAPPTTTPDASGAQTFAMRDDAAAAAPGAQELQALPTSAATVSPPPPVATAPSSTTPMPVAPVAAPASTAVPATTTASVPAATAANESPQVAADVVATLDTTPRAIVDPHARTRQQQGLRWRWPAAGRVIGRFVEGDPTQQGIDVGGQLGQVVLAASDGEVVYSGNGLLGYGELVIVQHSPGFLSAYGHNQKRLVAEGSRVKAGQPIAEMGRRGGVDMLHFEIRKNGNPVNPLAYLP